MSRRFFSPEFECTAKATNLFWLWTMLGVAWAWLIPEHFIWFAPFIGTGLGAELAGALNWRAR